MERIKIISRIKGDSWCVEKSEAQRIEKIINIIPSLLKWTPLDKVAHSINEKIPSVIFSVRLLFDAERIERTLPYGTEVIAQFPFIRVLKKNRHTQANLKKSRFLRAPIYIKKP